MKICRFDQNRLGKIEGDRVLDVSAALEVLPDFRWPVPPGDALIRHLDLVIARIEEIAAAAPSRPVSEIDLASPVANPGKIIGAPVNYQEHLDEAIADSGISFGADVPPIAKIGLFLKACSALVGPAEGVTIRFPNRRTDHELELAVIIGKAGTGIAYDEALDHVAGYSIGLDMTVRGTEDRGLRKSVDSYAVLGPWLVTRDEIDDPGNLDLSLHVNDELRQHSNTSNMIFDVRRLIEYASAFYTLHPGDIIMTGTPEGVAPVRRGDIMTCRIKGIGEMKVAVHGGS